MMPGDAAVIAHAAETLGRMLEAAEGLDALVNELGFDDTLKAWRARQAALAERERRPAEVA